MLAAVAGASLSSSHVAQLSDWFNLECSRGASIGDLVAIILLTRDHFETINGPAWSLLHEMRLAFVFPVVLLIARRVDWKAAIHTAVPL
jgi:hypothetical protein